MATKFTLNPNPTFSVEAVIPRPGQEDGKVTLTVRHKTRAQMAELEKDLKSQAELAAESGDYSSNVAAGYLESLIEGWNIDAEFNWENLVTLLENYPRAFDSIAAAYTKELYSVREKN